MNKGSSRKISGSSGPRHGRRTGKTVVSAGKLRLAIAGYGGRGRDLFNLAARSFPCLEPAAICDFSAEARELASKDVPGVPVYEDVATMLDACRPDALIVATPADFHADLCVQALDAGVSVLSEIPVVNSYGEARRLWDAHLKSKALYMAGANPNFWGFVEAAAQFRKDGSLGEPFYMEAEYVHDVRGLFAKTPWRTKFVSIKYCTHSLGPLLRLIDEDLETVACLGTAGFEKKEEGRGEAMAAIFRTISGVVVRLLTSFVNNAPFSGHRYRIYTSKGYFERAPVFGEGGAEFKTYFYSKDIHAERKMHELPVGFARPGYGAKDSHGGADFAMLESFMYAVRTGGRPPVSLKEGLRMTLPGIFAAESAARGGAPVRIRYPWNA